MEQTKHNEVHISELLEGSSVYDDVKGMDVHHTKVLNNMSIVHYSYDGNTFIDVWNCKNGMVLVEPGYQPDKTYTKGDIEFNVIHSLLVNS